MEKQKDENMMSKRWEAIREHGKVRGRGEPNQNKEGKTKKPKQRNHNKEAITNPIIFHL